MIYIIIYDNEPITNRYFILTLPNLIDKLIIFIQHPNCTSFRVYHAATPTRSFIQNNYRRSKLISLLYGKIQLLKVNKKTQKITENNTHTKKI